MKRLIKNLVFMLGDAIGLNWLFRKTNLGKYRILMYHGVSATKLPAFYWTHLDFGEFRWQMEYVKKYYQVLPASSLLGRKDQRIDNAVVITFDDGLENIYREAWPILRQLCLRASCFVLPALSEDKEIIWPNYLYWAFTGATEREVDLAEFGLGQIHLGSTVKERSEAAIALAAVLKAWPDSKRRQLMQKLKDDLLSAENRPYEQFRLMTPEQIRELSESEEFEIGLHGNSHAILSTLPGEQQADEIETSVKSLETWGIKALPIFAYPNGRLEDFNDDTIEALKHLSFKAAVTTVDGLHSPDDPEFFIKRLPVGADMPRSEFKARLSGFFYALYGFAGR